MSVKQTALKLAALVLAFAGIAAPAFAQTKNNPKLKVQWATPDTAGVISEFRIDPIAHHLIAYVTPEAAEPDPSPQAPGNWRTVAGLDGLTRVALKVSANGTLATGADPGGPIQGCSDCIVIGGLFGLTPTALKVGADGTVATSGGGGGGGSVSCSVAGGVGFETAATTLGCDAAVVFNSTSKQLTLTPTVDGASALVANPSSQNFGSVDPVINVNAGAGTITCKILGGFAPSEVCINGATNQPWLYNLSLTGDATNTSSPSLALWDTSRTTPNAAFGLWSVGEAASDFSANGTGMVVGYNSSTDGISNNIMMLGDHTIQLAAGGSTPYISWGPQGDIPTGYINDTTGEIQLGWIPNAFAVVGETGFLSIVDGAKAHKVSFTNPGTLASDYNFAMPITPGAAGQPMLSGGGGTTPMTWSASTLPSHVLISSTAPTLSSGFGTGASISANNGPAAFRLGVGTSNSGTGVVGLPAATTGWNCFATNITTKNTNQATVLQTASSTTSATFQNYTDIMGTHAMTDNDVLSISCFAY